MKLDEKALKSVDLNLLRVFMMVYSEMSVSRAAEQLNLGQPAVSSALGRLRKRFNDVLFVKSGKGVRPTTRAVEIAEALLPAINIIDSVVAEYIKG